MSIPIPRTRRTLTRLLSGVVLATVLAVSPGAAAMGGAAAETSGSSAAVAARTDIYLRDIPTDAGNEPHGYIYSSFFNSPDIAICPSAVPCTHTNPVVGSTSYIHAKLNNPGPLGSGDGAGKLVAYYTTSGGAANWPNDWTYIGEKDLPVVSPGVTTTSIAWSNVPTLGHFCLLLRWVSPTDPMNFEGTVTSINTQYNNNIVWKNANTVPAPGAGSVSDRPFAVGNLLPVAAPYDLAFRPVGEPVPGQRIVADLGAELFARWRAAGGQGEGIRVVGQNLVEVVDPYRAQIRGLPLNPKERPVLRLKFTQGQALQRAYQLEVVQVGPLQRLGERYDVGGVVYTIQPGKG